ncbi:MAG: hypothetical protein LAO22_06200 [Acidobacteriia bacterium]|nr:hypothetical protein [Terriglobia bacterium]
MWEGTALALPPRPQEIWALAPAGGSLISRIIYQAFHRGKSVASGEPVATQTTDVPQLPNHKVKLKKSGQRACNEKNDKGKFCGGHLKRWFYTADVLEQECGCAEKAWGADREVYRCEFCQTLYLPHPEDARGVNVAGTGQLSVFGLTVPPKEEKKA